MTTVNRFRFRRYLTLVAAAVALSWGTAAQAHCDTLDGPVVGRGPQGARDRQREPGAGLGPEEG